MKLKKQNEAIKDRLIRDIRNLLEQEEDDYYKPVRAGSFWKIKLNMKIMVTETKHY